jgi:hypothetical protein
MALLQGRYGKRGATAINPCEAGVTACQAYEIDLAAQALNTTDVAELGPLPPGATLVAATVIGEAIGAAITATVGLLTGEAGDPSNARALVGGTSNFITAGSINNTETAAARAACLNVPKPTQHQGIGLTVSGNIAAGAGKKVKVFVEYAYGL